MSTKKQLRSWQQDGLRKARAKFIADKSCPMKFLVSAFPGAGKTFFSHKFIQWAMEQNPDLFVFILAPSIEIKRTWGAGAEQFIGLSTHWSGNVNIDTKARRVHLSPNHKGMIMTYQGLATMYANSDKCRILMEYLQSKSILLIQDECHHMSESNTWGKAVTTIFGGFTDLTVFSLSGTPFRTDNTIIPFLPYKKDPSTGHIEYVPDVVVPYRDGVKDGYLRRIVATTQNGVVSIPTANDDVFETDFRNSIHKKLECARLRTALMLGKKHTFLQTLLRTAIQNLRNKRTRFKRAQGLVICQHKQHAGQIKELMEAEGCEVMMVVSERGKGNGQKNQELIGKFRKNIHGKYEWMIAVDMISEGVDIPNICTLVYASNKLTTMYINQSIGRAIRMSYENSMVQCNEAHLFMPEDERLVKVVRTLLKDMPPETLEIQESSSSEEDEREFNGTAAPPELDMNLTSLYDPNNSINFDGASVATDATAFNFETAYEKELNPQFEIMAKQMLLWKNPKFDTFEKCYQWQLDNNNNAASTILPITEGHEPQYVVETDRKKELKKKIKDFTSRLAGSLRISQKHYKKFYAMVMNAWKWNAVHQHRTTDRYPYHSMPALGEMEEDELKTMMNDDNRKVMSAWAKEKFGRKPKREASSDIRTLFKKQRN